MITVVLWRHGRTSYNHEHRTQGQIDSQLDEVGLAQAAASAPRLAALAPDLIVSSDLSRAATTAAALATLTGQDVTLDARLRERHFGRWQGLLNDEIEQRFPVEWRSFYVDRVFDADPTFEPLVAVGERVSTAIVEIARRLPEGGTAVVATHGMAARVGFTPLLGLPVERYRTFGGLDNCATSVLRHSGDDWATGWVLHAHNA